MPAISNTFLARIESLGDNCEVGFALRKLNFEKGGLFRWSITPVDKLIDFFADPNQTIYNEADLAPFSRGMVICGRTGFSFHTKMRSEKDTEGKLNYIVEETERHNIHAQEKSKIDYLRKGFIDRLQAEIGSIYLIKANNGIDPMSIEKLASTIKNYSSKHVLVEVRVRQPEKVNETLSDYGSHYVATISRFAPYVRANRGDNDEWERIFSAIENNAEIAKRIG